ncbi:MAG: aminopeptidase N [Acidiferrobacterales bacterium]
MKASRKAGKAKAVYLKDYRPPDYRIEKVHLDFSLGEESTLVRSRLEVVGSDNSPGQPLVLDGRELDLKSVVLDGRRLNHHVDYLLDTEHLTIPRAPGQFTLEIETEIHPHINTTLTGLYVSGGNFCTQCEAEGFRKITYFLDRPDVMARYTTTIVADKARYPVLLSNGNPAEHVDLGDGRHRATWVDPYPKPSYLFALVAGDLACIEDRFVTRSSRTVQLRMYVQHHNADKCGHAMASLRKAMQWDEQVFGREYDLDIYQIVAVDDFNMGAMENKGLNVFNSVYVLARPDTATDADYQAIERVIAHEYFHNWSGNRVTCRDWFQLSLKEGFTVYRDQEFGADATSRGVARVQDVNVLRTHQFREDAGPMAHAVRPESYVEINNFYTATVYNKGAEVVRMLRELIGMDGFRRGTDLYFERYDGQAVTTDDFVKAMEDANGINLSQFRLWYSQAGTPQLHIGRAHDARSGTYILHVRQSCPPTPGQPHKQPFHMPLAIALLDDDGQELPMRLMGEHSGVIGTRVLQLRQEEETFVFVGMPKEPVPSLLRGFSAPVRLQFELSDSERCFLLGCDGDSFSRWEAGQQLAGEIILDLAAQSLKHTPQLLNAQFVEAFRTTLRSDHLDKAMIAQALILPSETYLADFMDPIDPQALHDARVSVLRSLAQTLRDDLLSVYRDNVGQGDYGVDPESVGRRSLKNLCLSYLMELDDAETRQLCVDQFRRADNMTDVMAALRALVGTDCDERREALVAFHEKWRDEPLVMDKWFALQATSRLPGTLAEVKALTRHPAFNLKNPNRVRALIGSFCAGNPARFHDRSGAGYAFLADQVLRIDRLNPQLAARLVGALSLWRKYEARRQALMKRQLEHILADAGLSRDVQEIVSKSLESAGAEAKTRRSGRRD